MKKAIAVLAFLLCLFSVKGQLPLSGSSPWPVISKEMKPWTRWWWMGSAVEEKGLAEALRTYASAGIGGVEITPIYGARGYEDRYIEFLSPKWTRMLDYTVRTASALGMGVDMNTGTGWPFGGPQITVESGASKMIIQRYHVARGGSLSGALLPDDQQQRKAGAVLQALTAYGADGKAFSLLNKVDAGGHLIWVNEGPDAEVFALFAGRTLQQVKRAAPGGQGLTLDHLDKRAVDIYLGRFDEAFHHHPPGLRAFFNDSYEVYGANWTPAFLHEFEQRKGYDLGLHLKELSSKDATDTLAGRLKSDYRETMAQLLLEHFTRHWTDWAHSYKSLTRNQSHGSPGNLLDLYAAVDIPETETFGSSYFPIPGLRRDSADVRNVDPDPIMDKFASSAAHTTGKSLVSSETFTWLAEHFKTSFSQAKPEAEQLFLAGVNHLFYHGTTYSPSDVPFPGWLFYASSNFVPANSLWPQIQGMDQYFSRCQSILQSGSPDNELLIYWPVYDPWSNPGGMDMPMKVHDVDVWLHPTQFYKQSLSLQQGGYSFDFASDGQLARASVFRSGIRTTEGGNPYRTLIVPACTYMPLQTLKSILELASHGATVIFQKLPEDVPGLSHLAEDRREFQGLLKELHLRTVAAGVQLSSRGSGQVLLAGELTRGLQYKQIRGEPLSRTGLKFLRRKLADGTYYFVVNHTAATIAQWISLNHPAAVVTLMDPLTGSYGEAQTRDKDGHTELRLTLKSGESLFIKSGGSPPGAAWKYLLSPDKPLLLEGPWKLHFSAGGPELPDDKILRRLLSWTDLGDTAAVHFSGTGVYTSSFVLSGKLRTEYLLRLGNVAESAHVWINGKDAGILWSIPFETRVGRFLRPGKNTIRIEVVNLMANRIRYMDQKGVVWKNYHEINFVNINYKPFDASGWKPVSSGLLGPVTLTAYP